MWCQRNYIINIMLKKGEFSRSEKMISSPAHDEMASMASDNGIQGVVISEE